MSDLTIKQLSVFEPDLRALGSHHFEYVQLLRGAAARAGLAMRAFGHRDASAEVLRRTQAEGLFAEPPRWQTHLAASWPLRTMPRVRSALATALGNRRAARELTHALAALDWDGQLILVPNCNQGFAAAWGRCLREPLRRHPRARAVIVFPFLPSRHLFLRSFRALLPLVRDGRVALATDSEPLSELYRQLTGFTFTVLPMPYGPSAADGDEALAPAARPGGGTRFLACGSYRMEKGIDLLADLIENLEASVTAGAMTFTLQGFAYDTAPDPEAARHFARIKAVAARCPPGCITVIESALGTAEYLRLFARCDAAILPYRHAAYAIRTSGVLTECLARGKPVIATADTWLGQQVQTRRAGLVFPDGDAVALARATRLLNAELPRFAADAMAGRAAWLAFHNPDNYLRVVTALAAAATREDGPPSALARRGADALRSAR